MPHRLRRLEPLRGAPSGKSPPRLDARPPTSVHAPMPAPTTLSELITLYLARCRIEGLSPRTQRAYSETLARFQRSVECLDHLIIVNERHLRLVLREYVAHYNHVRPHQALELSAPDDRRPRSPPRSEGQVVGRPILGGLHHEYERLAA